VASLLSVDEAQARVLERVRPLTHEQVPTPDSDGRMLGEDALAIVDLPPFPSSAMDGYAVRAADLPGTLTVVGRVATGRPEARALGPGEAMGISTGGVVPEGADAVLPVEYVVVRDNEIETDERLDAGAHVRPQGGDLRKGDVVVPAGTLVRPSTIGAVLAAGIPSLLCARRPHVAVLSTGSELAVAGRVLGPGQVYEANSSMLAAAARSAGAEVERLAAVEDTEEAHRAALARGLEADVLVSTGGVSMGVHDLVRSVEAELGVEEVFWRVAVKPGKPVSFGVRGETLVFGLPGNPVSSLVGFELFVRPALRALQGSPEPLPRYERGRLSIAVRRNAARDELLRIRMERDGDDLFLEPLGGQESHMIGRAALADGLAFVPRGEGELAAGTVVDYLRLGV
jgi:molybdopterin molybdotransferase